MDYEGMAYEELMSGHDDESVPVDEDAPVADLFDNPEAVEEDES